MPISDALLEQIKNNDPTLKTLDLIYRALNHHDIQPLVNALRTNTTLTTLNIMKNQIGDAGAKALAATTLTMLDVGNNQIGAEGAKALAANATFTTLDVGNNQIGTEGAKALAANATLTTLNVGNNQVGVEGVKVLAANTTLTTLGLNKNKIDDEGVKALAANAILTTMDLSENQIGDEGVKALAANTTLTELDLSENKISNEGAKALAANTTLTTLYVRSNKIGDEEREQLNQTIKRNRQQIRRAQFIQALIVLAYDTGNKKSQSLWSQLPQELMVHIISLIVFRPPESIGKNVQQIGDCAEFIFCNVSLLKGSLTESIRTKQAFKLVEKIARGKSQFQFFPPTAQITAEEKSNEKPNKIRKTF